MTLYLVYILCFISIGLSSFSLGYSLGVRSQLNKDKQEYKSKNRQEEE